MGREKGEVGRSGRKMERETGRDKGERRWGRERGRKRGRRETRRLVPSSGFLKHYKLKV